MRFLLFLFVSINISCINSNNISAQNTYKVKQDSVFINTSNGKIFGIYFKPIGTKGKIPAILCLQGGGNVGLSNYFYEARYFAKNGIAALVCDKSGTGRSQTSKTWEQQTFNAKTNEYITLHNWLSNQEGIDNTKVGVHGMSEGGRLSLNMAIEYPNKIAFVNAVSAPIASFKENQLYAIKHFLQIRGNDETVIKEALVLWESFFNDVGNGKITNKTLALHSKLRVNNPNLRYIPSNSRQLPLRPHQDDIHFSLIKSIGTIKCPVLFQYGELDI